MTVKELEEHVGTLATLEETEAPVVSCYLDVASGPSGYRSVADERVQLLRRSLAAESREPFQEAWTQIEDFLQAGLAPGTRGVAVFARVGANPFFLPLQFEVAMPNWIAASPTPNIYHLMELKDNYDRYVVLLATETGARIIGVNLGSITEQVWQSRPELRQRVAREWSKDHFQDHRRERTRQFVHEQVRTLEHVISAGGYGHLVLAGSARVLAAVRKALPRHLAAKLVDIVPASANDRISDVVASTLQSFLEHEEQESQAIADRLISQIHTHGLAVAGTFPTWQALRTGQADFLVLAKDYDPGRGWECRGCGKVELDGAHPDACPACRAGRLREFDVKGEMVRLAGQLGCGVEVVEHSDALMSLGGVGCLLRFLAPAHYIPTAA